MKLFSALSMPYRIVGISSTIALAMLLTVTFVMIAMDGVSSGFANKDFANYWTAGKLILQGQTADLFGPHPIYFAHLQAAFGEDYQWHNWSYPPHYLLFMWPLGFFGYEGSMILFLGASFVAFAWALRLFIGRLDALAVVAVGPLVIHNIWTAQNGFLTGALALGALGLRERRPLLAGVLLGMLTVKPQLGLLFPFLLLAERRWTMIASTVATAAAMVILSIVLFGVDAWRGYIGEVIPYQTHVMRYLVGTFQTMMPSVYGAVRFYGAGPDLSLAIHGLVALPVTLLSIYAFFRLTDAAWRSVVLLVATFIVSPYALTYDLGMFAAGVAMFIRLCERARPFTLSEECLLAIVILLPAIMMPVGASGFQIAPVIMIGLLTAICMRSGLVGRRRFTKDGSPASASG